MNSDVDISIVTPSYNMLEYLKLCSASISDQAGISFEHIVIDGASTDGTQVWLTENIQIRSVSEKDNGMYEAINKGFKIAQGAILAYLNCDEQYLPNTLKTVCEYFNSHPDIDIVFGNMLLIKPDGSLVAYRKSFKPIWYFILSSYLYTFTCTMFFRSDVISKYGNFCEKYSGISDAEFVVRLLKSGCRAGHINKYLSVFTLTGNNLCLYNDKFNSEKIEYLSKIPLWLKLLKVPLNFVRMLLMLLKGAYFQIEPIRYSIFVSGDLKTRKFFKFDDSSFRWPKCDS